MAASPGFLAQLEQPFAGGLQRRGLFGSSFFREPVKHLIRFHFAKQTPTLQAAGERLLKLREKARGRGH